MYYPWAGWWFFLWLIPVGVLFWALVGWNGPRRRYLSRDRWWRDGDLYEDVSYVPRSTGRRYRNRGPRNYRRSDARILEDVSDRLMLSDDVDPSAVDVTVESGEVTLSGTVSTRHEKRLAEQLVDAVAGVTDVHNALRIGKVDHTRETPLSEHGMSARHA